MWSKIVAGRRAERLLRTAQRNPEFSDRSLYCARIAYDLGLVYKASGRSTPAREQFELARRAAAAQKADAMLTKIDAALASL
jgi:hypothetical protein